MPSAPSTSIIATGGRPLLPPIPGAELGITSDGFFALPRGRSAWRSSGSGYIAVELAGIFAGLGSETTLILRGETVLKEFRCHARASHAREPARPRGSRS